MGIRHPNQRMWTSIAAKSSFSPVDSAPVPIQYAPHPFGQQTLASAWYGPAAPDTYAGYPPALQYALLFNTLLPKSKTSVEEDRNLKFCDQPPSPARGKFYDPLERGFEKVFSTIWQKRLCRPFCSKDQPSDRGDPKSSRRRLNNPHKAKEKREFELNCGFACSQISFDI